MSEAAILTTNRIDACFEQLLSAGRKGLIVYLTAGDPDLETSLALLRAAVAGGADVIELGLPAAEPFRDGPVIRAAHARALSAGGSIAATLALLQRFRAGGAEEPVVLMGYDAAVRATGYARFLEQAAAAGADGLIIADLDLDAAARDVLPLLPEGLVAIPLGSPEVEPGAVLAAHGQGGFLYCVPVAGPTGGPVPPLPVVVEQVSRWRRATDLPVAVGFGIKTPADAATIAAVADGVVVASALIGRIAAWAEAGATAEALADRLAGLVGTYRAAIDAG